SGLRASERDGFVAEVVDGHRAERVRDPLADRDEHVVLARLWTWRDLVGEPDQLVGGVAHRREDGHHAASLFAGADEPARDVLDLLGVRDRGAAELHHDEVGPACRRVGCNLRNGLEVRRRHRYISRRPASARPSVTSSAYSRSPPTGSPLARRVTRTRSRRRPARYDAVASPVALGFVARTTSTTPSLCTRCMSSSIRRCSGSTPSSGESAPPRTWYRPRYSAVRSSETTSTGCSTTQIVVRSRRAATQMAHDSSSVRLPN